MTCGNAVGERFQVVRDLLHSAVTKTRNHGLLHAEDTVPETVKKPFYVEEHRIFCTSPLAHTSRARHIVLVNYSMD